MSLGVTQYVNVCVQDVLYPIPRIPNLIHSIGSGSTMTLTQDKTVTEDGWMNECIHRTTETVVNKIRTMQLMH